MCKLLFSKTFESLLRIVGYIRRKNNRLKNAEIKIEISTWKYRYWNIVFSFKMQAVNANEVPVIIVNHPGRWNQDKRLPYNNMRNGLARGLIALGSLHVVFGILGITLQAVQLNILETSTPYLFSLAYTGYGFWTGIIVSITLAIYNCICFSYFK